MSKASLLLAKQHQRKQVLQQATLTRGSAEERHALHKLRTEARAKGCELRDNGKGRLPSSLVLHVFRRDDYRCTVHGDTGHERGGLTLHHRDEAKSKTSPSNLVVVCHHGHDELHAGGDQRL